MKKKRVGIIGYGKWAKIMIPILSQYFNISFIINSNINYKFISLNKIEWLFILTNNSSHYEIVKFFLKKKVNIFCEKPLTKSLKQTLYLFNLAKINNCRLYVNDVEFFKYKKIKILKKNRIIRLKKSLHSNESLLFRLAYHDFYLLKNYIDIKKIINIKFLEKKNFLKFCFRTFENIKFSFFYKTNSIKKIHKINLTNFLKFKKNPLHVMFDKMEKNLLDFNSNMLRSVFANHLISILNKKYK